MRRALRWPARVLAVLACFAGGMIYAAGTDTTTLKVVRVSAKRFVFVPSEITLKKGETVEIELQSEDVPMGFSLPDFATRSDIIPGQVTRLRFTPDRTGRFTFLCDIFCGSGHENMDGVITVVD